MNEETNGYISKTDALKSLCSTCDEDVSTCGLCVEYSTIAKVCPADVKPDGHPCPTNSRTGRILQGRIQA